MTEAQKKKRAERIIDFYRVNYSVPFWYAYRDNNQQEMSRRLERQYNFKLGLTMADPHARWYQRLNKVDIQVKKMICPEDDDP